MLTLGVVVAGGLITLGALARLPGPLTRPPHARENFRGATVAGTAGLVLVGPASLGAVVALMAGTTAGVAGWIWVAACATAAFGLLDDLAGDRSAGGLLGHARALARGRVTTGAVKAGAGAAIGLVTATGLGLRGGWIVAGGAVVALSSNLANLFDLRPARTFKVWLPCVGVLVWIGVPDGGAWPLLALIGAGASFIRSELREQVMLGDTGAGLLGAAAGAATVAVTGPSVGLMAVLGALVALHGVAEVTTFSRLIEAVAPLRAYDRLGRRP